jgi:hypothetical protein
MTWTTTTPAAVRCIDCRHWRGAHGWCATARRNANSARAVRRCKHFSSVPTALDYAREAIEQAGLRDAVELAMMETLTAEQRQAVQDLMMSPTISQARDDGEIDAARLHQPG